MSHSLHSCHWGQCQLQFDSLDNLFTHVSNNHIGRKSTQNLSLQCQWNGCGTTAAKRDHLASHLRVHFPLKPYICSTCNKSFKRPQDLKKHERIHTLEHQASLVSNQPGYKSVRRKRRTTTTAENKISYSNAIAPSQSNTVASTTISASSTVRDLSDRSVSDLSSTYNSPNTNSNSQQQQQQPPYSISVQGEEEGHDVLADLYHAHHFSSIQPQPAQSVQPQQQQQDPLQAFISDILFNQTMPTYDTDMMEKLNVLGSTLQLQQQPSVVIPCAPEHALTLQHWLEQLSTNIVGTSNSNLCTFPNTPLFPNTTVAPAASTISPECLLQQDCDLYPRLDLTTTTDASTSNDIDFLTAAFNTNYNSQSISPLYSTSTFSQRQQAFWPSSSSLNSNNTASSRASPGYIYSTPLLYHNQAAPFDNHTLMSNSSSLFQTPCVSSQQQSMAETFTQRQHQQPSPPPLPPRRNYNNNNIKQTIDKPLPPLPPRKQQQQQGITFDTAIPPPPPPLPSDEELLTSSPSFTPSAIPVIFETANIPSKGMTPVIDYSTAITFEEKKEIMHLMNLFSSAKTKPNYKKQVSSKNSKTIARDEEKSDGSDTTKPSTLLATRPTAEQESNTELYPSLVQIEEEEEKIKEEQDTSPYADLVGLLQNMSLEHKQHHSQEEQQQYHVFIVNQLLKRIPSITATTTDI